MHCRGTVGRDIALRCPDGAARRPYQTAADEQSMSTTRKGDDELLLVFPCHCSGGNNQRIGRWRRTNHVPLLMLVVTPVTADATSAVALFFAYPTAVWRTRDQLAGVLRRGWLWLLLIPSVIGGLIGAVLLSRTGNRSFIQLVTVVGVSRHGYHCAAADPGSTR